MPTDPQQVIAAPSQWKNGCRKITASAKKWTPTTTDTQATPASGRSSGPESNHAPTTMATTSSATTNQ